MQFFKLLMSYVPDCSTGHSILLVELFIEDIRYLSLLVAMESHFTSLVSIELVTHWLHIELVTPINLVYLVNIILNPNSIIVIVPEP